MMRRSHSHVLSRTGIGLKKSTHALGAGGKGDTGRLTKAVGKREEWLGPSDQVLADAGVNM